MADREFRDQRPVSVRGRSRRHPAATPAEKEMKKLRKEDVQKIALVLLMWLEIVYGYFDLLLGPVKARQKNIVASIGALDPEIGKAKAQLARAVHVENDAPKAEATIATINAM